MSTDKIEKDVVIKAPVSRVWRAIADTKEFGAWFGVKLVGEFAPAKTLTGEFDAKMDEAMIMEAQKRSGLTPSRIKMPPKGSTFCTVEKVEPESYFSFRWIPYGIDAEADPTNEPT